MSRLQSAPKEQYNRPFFILPFQGEKNRRRLLTQPDGLGLVILAFQAAANRMPVPDWKKA
jgi:hypothetical protein